MSVEIKYTSNLNPLMDQFRQCLYAYLEEGGATIEAEAIKNTPSGDTGRLRGDWRHEINMDEQQVVIGNGTEYAIWAERGTGEYAINGDGRKGEWTYRDEAGNWHTTTGTKPHRMLENAWNEKIGMIQDVLLPSKFKEMSS